MRKIFNNQSGVTMIELLAAFVIVTILLTSVISALLFGQKTIVSSDNKNNQAAIGQGYIDEIVTRISNGEAVSSITRVGTAEKGIAVSMDDTTLPVETPPLILHQFNDVKWAKYPRQFFIKQYSGSSGYIGYNVYYRSYDTNGNAQINFTAFAKKNGN